MTKPSYAVMLLAALLFASACSLFSTTNDATEVEPPAGADADWVSVGRGVDYRTLPATPSNANDFQMHIVRIDPTQAQFRVIYEPGQILSYTTWENQLGDEALVFVNANFFSESNLANGLVIADGSVFGTSYAGFGGMFAVDGNGIPTITSLSRTPYQGGNYIQAVQSFPMLVEPGGVASSTGVGFDDPARRTIIAQDSSGRVYLMSTGVLGQISLRDLQTWLLNSPLNVDAAFALDGGRSSLMYVRTDPTIQIPSFSNVPVILAVYER